jgi:RNA ligase (TIGR02306 family)
MSKFEVNVVKIDDVSDHPNADRLSVIKIKDYLCISGKLEDGSHRYSAGDLVVYVPENSIVPEYILRNGFWDTKNDRGGLAGSNYDRVKAIRLRGIFSQGILLPVEAGAVTNEIQEILVSEGDDVSEFLGITKYEPPIPVHMAGEVFSCAEAIKFDFESIQKIPDMFEETDIVEVTEKLHGTCCQIGYVPGLNHPDAFGEDKCIYVISKGLGSQGLSFKNNEANKNNVYVRALNKLLSEGLEEKLRNLTFGIHTVRLFGEVVGKGIQDLDYGLNETKFFAFDLKIGNDWISPNLKLDVGTVPILYYGPFNKTEIEKLRDGKDTLSNSHIREGVVIRAFGKDNAFHGRKIAKWVSPDYLLRKNATEYT